MRWIRLTAAFSRDHVEIPEGTVIQVSSELAQRLVENYCSAVYIDEERAVVEPEETRVAAYPSTRIMRARR